jgi:hypothetical protein
MLPAPAVPVDTGIAPLSINGHPSSAKQLTFPLPDHWRNDPTLNRGVYEREFPIGDDVCRVTVVTRGETRKYGLDATRPQVKFRFGGGKVTFKPIEHRASWYRSATAVDADNPFAWKATGVAVLSGNTVVLAVAHAELENGAGDHLKCGVDARSEIATGLRTILDGAAVKPV